MNIQIILTSYLLKFMFGENPFQDPFLLSREIIKKAYNEGLYFISNERTVDALLKENVNEQRGSLFVFAGIPSFEDICLNLSALKTIYAVRIKLPYEEMIDFELEMSHGEMILYKENVKLPKKCLEKVSLYLNLEKEKLVYKLEENNMQISLPDALTFLLHDIKNYHYAIKSKLAFLEDELSQYLASEEGLNKLENFENLQLIKEIYEELV